MRCASSSPTIGTFAKSKSIRWTPTPKTSRICHGNCAANTAQMPMRSPLGRCQSPHGRQKGFVLKFFSAGGQCATNFPEMTLAQNKVQGALQPFSEVTWFFSILFFELWGSHFQLFPSLQKGLVLNSHKATLPCRCSSSSASTHHGPVL